jgi:hypothetical protein
MAQGRLMSASVLMPMMIAKKMNARTAPGANAFNRVSSSRVVICSKSITVVGDSAE